MNIYNEDINNKEINIYNEDINNKEINLNNKKINNEEMNIYNEEINFNNKEINIYNEDINNKEINNEEINLNNKEINNDNINNEKNKEINNEKNNKILEHLLKLYDNNNIPNIIFHGNNLSGKKTILERFLNNIYKTNDIFNKYVLIINCSHGKGNIKFIRENLKHFSNSIINNKDKLFKSVILLNADKLTIDAQSALRRCIEIYNHSTRFFIVIDNKEKLLKPILSRFSDIYFNDNKNNIIHDDILIKKMNLLNKKLNSSNNIIYLCEELYNNGYSGNILMEYIKCKMKINKEKFKFLLELEIYKKEIRDEKIIILFCLNYILNNKENLISLI